MIILKPKPIFFLLSLCFNLLFGNIQNKNIAIKTYTLPPKLTFDQEVCFINTLELNERFISEFNKIMYDKRGYYTTVFNRYLRYKKEISKILKKFNLSEDFIFLAIVESGLNTNVKSGARAAGMWQMIPSTARYYGLRVDNIVDERFDYKKATNAACEFIEDLLAIKDFNNDLFLAISSFNAGQKAITQALRNQGNRRFWDLVLAPETESYPVKVLLLKEIFTNPKRYDFKKQLQTQEKRTKWLTIKIENQNKKLSYNNLCSKLNISFREFKKNNPHLKYNYYRKQSYLNSYTKVWFRVPKTKIKKVKKYIKNYGIIEEETQESFSFNVEKFKTKKRFLNKTLRSADFAFLKGQNWQELAQQNKMKYKTIKSGIKVPVILKVEDVN